MRFNPDKCEVIRITNKRKIIQSEYKIHSQSLKLIDKAKYLGVTIDSKLSWNAHVEAFSKKANNTLSFLRRNLPACPKDVKATCYKTLVRPQLEYASTVWDPHTKNNINKLESVKRHAARFCHSDYQPTSSVSAMIQDLELKHLQTRRQHVKAAMLYRIVHQLVDIHAVTILIPIGAYTRGHANRFLPAFGSVNAYKHSFYPTSIRLWNSLPAEVITVPTLKIFKTRLAATLP